MTLSNLLLKDILLHELCHAHVLPVGMFAIQRECVISEDFMKTVCKLSDTEKVESKLA